MTTGGVNSLLKDFAKKYDIREDVMHAHAFRHFFAIQSLNNGVDMSLLKDLLGHGSIDTTQIYTQLSSAEQKSDLTRLLNGKVVERMEQYEQL